MSGALSEKPGAFCYSPNVLVGNWVEDRCNPTFSGLRHTAETEKQIRELEATGKRIPPYGAHLLEKTRKPASASGSPTSKSFEHIEDRFDYANLINPDRMYPASTWASVTQSTHFGVAHKDADEFSSHYKLAQTSLTGDADALQAYRKRWINNDDPAVRESRFGAETALALSAPFSPPLASPAAQPPIAALESTSRATTQRKLAATTMAASRFIPGATKGVEELRDKMLERYDEDGVWVLLRALPARFNFLQLRKIFETLELNISLDRTKDLWKECDAAERGEIKRDDLARVLCSHAGTELRSDASQLAWDTFHAVGHDKVTIALVKRFFDASQLPTVKAKRITQEQAQQRLIEGLKFVLDGEPYAHPPQLHYHEGDAVEAAPFLHSHGSGSVDAALLSRSITPAQFLRYLELISAGVDNDVDFVDRIVWRWHLYDTVHILQHEDLSPMLRSVLSAASRKAHGVQANRKGQLPDPPAPHFSVIVQHSAGNKSLQKVPTDRFFDASDKLAIINRLRLSGVSDIVNLYMHPPKSATDGSKTTNVSVVY